MTDCFDVLGKIPAEAWRALSFLPILLLLLIPMWRADCGDASTFKFVHLVTNDAGRGSASQVAYTAFLALSAWAMFMLVVEDKLNEWFFAGCLSVFVIGKVADKGITVFGRAKGAAEPEATAGDNEPKGNP